MTSLGTDLRRLISAGQVFDQAEDLLAYADDATYYFASHRPDAVVIPRNSQEASAIIKYAYRQALAITPRGAGSGLAGGCTPVEGGIVVDLKQMNAILDVDSANLTAEVQAGVVLKRFQNLVEKRGLFYPPDPQSMSVCTIGGNVATRAGGPRGVKYGTTQNYITGLEVVLPEGEIIKTGGKVVKQSAGYNLTQLMAGSEGTLGIITRVNLRLLSLPPHHNTMVVSCESPEQAARIVSAIIAGGSVPAMMEFLVKVAVMVMNNYIKPPLPLDYEAYLLIDVDGSTAQVVEGIRQIAEICQDLKAPDVRIIENPQEAATYWEARSNLYPLMLSLMKRVITEDVTVPRNRIPDLVRAVQQIAEELGVMIGQAGHAGDGNMHPTILMSQIDGESEARAQQAVDRIIETGLALGGTISGEHGIGVHKQAYLEKEMGAVQVALMKRIKAAFDPRGLMNPGKIWVTEGDTI